VITCYEKPRDHGLALTGQGAGTGQFRLALSLAYGCQCTKDRRVSLQKRLGRFDSFGARCKNYNMKSKKASMSYIKDILDAKAAQADTSSELPKVNPSVVINFPGDGWKPIVLSFTNPEEVSEIEIVATNMAFALGVGSSRVNIPKPDLVTIITPAELYGGMNDDDGVPIPESREHQGYAIAALSMKPDRSMVFNARNIMYKWSEDGIKNAIEVTNDREVLSEKVANEVAAPAKDGDGADFFVSNEQESPLLNFWKIFDSTTEAYEAASPEIQDNMDSMAREILNTTLPWLMADGTLNHINRIGHEL